MFRINKKLCYNNLVYKRSILLINQLIGVGRMANQTIFKEEIKTKLKKPKMYRVIIHNDDYTTMEFVIEVLVKVFHKKVPEATKIMLDVHNKGKGIVGVYTLDIAATKIAQVKEMALESGFPLNLTMEEE